MAVCGEACNRRGQSHDEFFPGHKVTPPSADQITYRRNNSGTTSADELGARPVIPLRSVARRCTCRVLCALGVVPAQEESRVLTFLTAAAVLFLAVAPGETPAKVVQAPDSPVRLDRAIVLT